MGLYGSIAKVGSSQFQFDKVYHSRKDMDIACTEGDGVYAGRYVLVNYGEDGIRYNKIINENNDVGYEVTQAYAADEAKDLEEYGTSYDSTVWQKIYSGDSSEKYIMIAELNSDAPDIHLRSAGAVNYKQAGPNDTPETVYVYTNEQNDENGFTKLSDVKITYPQPSFSKIYDNTESYYLNMPQTLELDVQDKFINYNKQGFDIVYSLDKKENEESYIRWIPVGLNDSNYTSTNGVNVNRKELVMNIPDFGNTIKELYDLIYGQPDPDTHVRAFFKDDWTKHPKLYQMNEDGTAYILDENNKPIQTEEDRNYTNDDELWLAGVKGIGELLSKNSVGLATILSSLIGQRNPVTGEITFYLKTDWQRDTEEGILIQNKPEIVGTDFIRYVVVPTKDSNGNDTAYDDTVNYYYYQYNNETGEGQYILYDRTDLSDNNNWSNYIANGLVYYRISDKTGDYSIIYDDSWVLT